MNAADILTVLLGVAALQAAVFGGFQISIRNPWRPLLWAVLLCGLRHYLVRTAPMHERLRHWTRRVSWIDIRRVWWIDAARKAASRGATGFHAQRGWLEAMHVGGLWSVAVLQPLFDVLGRGPDESRRLGGVRPVLRFRPPVGRESPARRPAAYALTPCVTTQTAGVPRTPAAQTPSLAS